jgi:hypothetical protein
MSILVQATVESGPESTIGSQQLTVNFLDEASREVFGEAAFTIYPFAHTIESFGRHSSLASLLEDEDADEARILYYDPEVLGTGTLEWLDVPSDRIGEALLALRRSYFGRIATITLTQLDCLADTDSADAEVGLRRAGFNRFGESNVWLTSTAAPEA